MVWGRPIINYRNKIAEMRIDVEGFDDENFIHIHEFAIVK